MKLGVVSVTVVISLLLRSSQAAPMVDKVIRDAMTASPSSSSPPPPAPPLDGAHKLTQKWPTNDGNGRDFMKRFAPVDNRNQPHFFAAASRDIIGGGDDGSHAIQNFVKRVRIKSDGESEIFQLS